MGSDIHPRIGGGTSNVNHRDGESEHSGSEGAPLPRQRRGWGLHWGNGGGYVLVGLISEDFRLHLERHRFKLQRKIVPPLANKHIIARSV